MTAGDDPTFRALASRIASGAGLTVEMFKDKCLRRRIAVRMRACGAASYADYLTLIDREPAELVRLREALTINVTRVYRNPETWERLRRDILPALVMRRRGVVRAWSAGCSSGEEAYTIAMVLADAIDAAGPRAGRGTVDATDLDRPSLERARAGRYPAGSFSETPADLLARFWRPAGDGFEPTDRLRAAVRVRELDLGRVECPPATYDLIVCRNVVIYFERPTQERLFAQFADALAPGGVLVLGKVETLFGPARERLEVLDPRERIFRRPE